MQAAVLIFKEIKHRKVSFLLALLAAVAAVALCVGLVIMQDAAARETRRVTRDAGSNIRIIPKAADPFVYHELGYSKETMPEAYLDTMAKAKDISYNHLIAQLIREIEVAPGKGAKVEEPGVKKKVRLIGMAPTRNPPGHKKKSKMGYAIPTGELYVGHAVGKFLGVKKGGEIELLGRSWKIARVQPEKGTVDDISIMALMSDVQAATDTKGQISEIKAIDCLCLTADENPLLVLRKEIETMLPEAQVLHDSELSDVRARQRQMMDSYSPFIISSLLIVSAAWIGVLAVINVRERTSEIGLFRALGYGSGFISMLVLGRALLIGLFGALVGYFIGCFLATSYGPEFFRVTAKAIKAQPALLGWAVIAAPLLAMLASFIPAALAVNQDPADTLRQE